MKNKIEKIFISPPTVHGEDSTPMAFFERVKLAEFHDCCSALVSVWAWDGRWDCLVDPPEEAGNHTFNKTRFTEPFQGQCIVPSCKSHPKTFCLSCTRDVPEIVYVCKPSATKHCWNILHQARCPHPVDQQGNPIDRPKLTRKRRRNSSHETQRVSRAQKKPLVLNPHHAQLEGW